MGPVMVGIDIGQKHDPTALAVVEVVQGAPAAFAVRHLERLPLGLSYPDVATRLGQVVGNLHARARADYLARTPAPYWPGEVWADQAQVAVYVDATGVGQPVVDLLARQGVAVTACYFTYGDRYSAEVGRISIGKAWLVSRLQVLLQEGRLHLPARLAEAAALTQELLDYEMRVDQDANEKYGAFRTGAHDDLVTAVGLAVQQTPLVPSILY